MSGFAEQYETLSHLALGTTAPVVPPFEDALVEAVEWSVSPDEARMWLRAKKVFKVAVLANAVKRSSLPEFMLPVWDFAEQECRERVEDVVIENASPSAAGFGVRPPASRAHFSPYPVAAIPTPRELSCRIVRTQKPVDEHAAVFQKLRAIFVRMGEAGRLWRDLVDVSEADQTAYWDELCEQWRESTVGTLNSYVSLAERWEEHACQKKFCPWRASSVQLSLFLRSSRSPGPGRKGGPTAPLGNLRKLRWLVSHLGAPLPVHDRTVAAAARVPHSHKEAQAVPWRPAELMTWEALCSNANAAVRSIALTWCVLIHACMRFGHAQRITVVDGEQWAILITAKRGKKRVQGSRPPLSTSMPRFGVTGLDFWPLIDTLFSAGTTKPPHQEGIFQRDFLLPELLPRRKALGAVSSFGHRPMHSASFSLAACIPPFSLKQT